MAPPPPRAALRIAITNAILPIYLPGYGAIYKWRHPIFEIFDPLPCHPFHWLGLWNNVNFWQIPLHDGDVKYGWPLCMYLCVYCKYKREKKW